MNPIALNQIAEWMGAAPSSPGGAATVTGVSTDTRTIGPGALYVALRGPLFDGHVFVSEAARRGAVAAVVDTACEAPEGFPLIRTENTLAALQALAGAYRKTLPVRIVGVTGSNGKTTAKDFTAAVLGTRFSTLKTEGNLNNHIGVPQMLLRLDASHQAGVIEMGMNHAGEIAPLAEMAAPEAAIITNIGIAHIENLGSREAIAAEKAALAEAVPDWGSVILDADDDYTPFIAERIKASLKTIGLEKGDLRASGIAFDENGSRFEVESAGERLPASLPVPGAHMVRNALFALAAGTVFGVPLAEGIAALAAVELTKGRLQSRLVRGIHFLDDSYNANPDSMIAALKTLAALPVAGRRVAVLGHMAELGQESDRGHRAVGEAVVREGIDVLVSVGPKASLIASAATGHGAPEVFQMQTTREAGGLLRELLKPGDLVLIKGSRSARMEQVLQEVEQ